jgi:hypothetical protein
MTSRNVFLVAIGLLMLRVALICWGGQLEAPKGDQQAFYLGAQQLTQSSSEWLRGGGEFGYRAPLYFIYLAAVFDLFPHTTFITGQIATAIIGVLNCLLMFALISNLYGSEAGKWAFWARGILPSFVVADTFVMSEPLFATFLLSILWIISRKPNNPNRRQAMGLGFLVACSLLTREVAIAFPIVFGGYLIICSASKHDGLRNIALFVVIMAITLVPWMWRNIIVWGKPLPISYTSGVNLHIGNNPQATGKWMGFSEELEERSLGFGSPESDAWHRKAALLHIKENPIHFVKLGFKKVAWLLWPRFEREEIKNVYKLPSLQATLLSGVLGVLSAGIMIMGVAGLVVSRRDWFWWLGVVLISYSALVSFVVYGSPRYRDTIDYLLVAFAVCTIKAWPSFSINVRIKDSPARKQALIIGVFVAYLFINWMWIAYDLSKGDP